MARSVCFSQRPAQRLLQGRGLALLCRGDTVWLFQGNWEEEGGHRVWEEGGSGSWMVTGGLSQPLPHTTLQETSAVWGVSSTGVEVAQELLSWSPKALLLLV